MVDKTKTVKSDKKRSVDEKAKTSKTKSKNQIEGLKTELKTEKDSYLRLFAEFENYKKRTVKERLELFKTANQEVISALIPVLDDYDRAALQAEKLEEIGQVKGFLLIYDKLFGVLKSNGLAVTETKVGDVFDVELHEAVTQIPATEKGHKGKIVDIVEKGYKLGDKIIRYPKVIVGQ